MRRKVLPLLLCALVVLAAVVFQLAAPASAAEEPVPYVTDGTTTAADVLDAWATGSYSYVQLGADLELILSGDENLVVDLAGRNLTVTGSGMLYAFDTANDTYDHISCGILAAGEGVTCEPVFDAPNGNRYVALTEGSYTTLHRLNMKITAVSLRMSCAGMYYKAVYECDRLLQQSVRSYGVAVSTVDMPGADFATSGEDLYTVVDGADFVSGSTVNSGIVANIMDAGWGATENLANTKKDIYAKVYINIDGNLILDTNGVGRSMMDLLTALDGQYDSFNATVQGQLDDFYDKWKTQGVNWSFTNIGKGEKTVDNSNLIFDEGTTNAICPVCEKKVTWTALTSSTASTTAENGKHYYLSEDVTYTTAEQAFLYAPGYNQEACFHLNGHNITATAWRVFHSGSGVLNIMGNGIVAGYNKKSTHGAAIHTSSSNPNSMFNLYGGTYQKVPNTPYTGAVIMIADGGGNVTIHEGVTVQADSKYQTAIKVCKNNNRDANVILDGCTVTGHVLLSEPNADDDHKTNLELIDCYINGEIKGDRASDERLSGRHAITMTGEIYIRKLRASEDVRITTKGLTEGSRIYVDALGRFSNVSGSVVGYLDYFKPYNDYDLVSVKNNALYCGKDYVSDLKFINADGDDTTADAYCPACEASVVWTELVGGTTQPDLVNGGHYYLAEDQTYTGTKSTFLSFDNRATICVHLNGHNLTATNTRALWTGTGTSNIMGTGIISGKNYGNYSGSALYHSSSSGVINLYSGTYQQVNVEDTELYTLNMEAQGGTLNIYEDAVVKTTTGNAIRVGVASAGNIAVNIYNATVEGNIWMRGADQTKGNTTSLTLDGAKVTGTADIDGINTVNLVHDVRIGLLDLEDTTKVTLDRLTDGADITVKNPGEFTNVSDKASAYAAYFTPGWINDQIIARDNTLMYKVNYTYGLLPNSENQAYCPVCRETVTWQAFASDDATYQFTDGGHFYLTRDLEFTAESGTGAFLASGTSGTTTCLHLNGHDVTSTQEPAIAVSDGLMNVMGTGVVKGNSTNTNGGCAVSANNDTAGNGIKLYSGTYTKYAPKSANSVITIGEKGGSVAVYEDAVIDSADSGLAVYTGTATNRVSQFILNNATVYGDVVIPGAADSAVYQSTFESINGTVTGTVTITGDPEVSFSGRTVLGKLVPAENTVVNFENMLSGSAIKVSAEGTFSSAVTEADDWLQYFSTDDTGDWVIVRDKTFYQGVKTGLSGAEQTDIDSLLAAYGDRVVRFGEMHNHSITGPEADGYRTIAEWKTGMEELNMDFATIVDHRQSVHMYDDAWSNEMFIGGTETGTDISDLPAGKNNIHYNLIFSDPAQLEMLITSGHAQFASYNKEEVGYTFQAKGDNTFAEVESLAALVRELGGFFAHVHPKYDGYVDSDNPLDYYFGEYTGIEVMCATSTNSDSRADWNQEAYDLWVDLLELDKKVYATYGNDDHKTPTTYSLTAIYTEQKDAAEYVEHMRNGDFTPGWVGVRMQVGDATMGGTTSFDGQRLVISAGEMFAGKYDATHKYIIQLYDDGGLLMESELNPSEMNYYAMDADPDAKFYRVLIWDATIGAHVAVGNPIWNG